MNDSELLSKKTNALQELLASQQTLLLSTASVTGIPDLSYAPFVWDEAGCLYVFISELAVHTDNLYQSQKVVIRIHSTWPFSLWRR